MGEYETEGLEKEELRIGGRGREIGKRGIEWGEWEREGKGWKEGEEEVKNGLAGEKDRVREGGG